MDGIVPNLRGILGQGCLLIHRCLQSLWLGNFRFQWSFDVIPGVLKHSLEDQDDGYGSQYLMKDSHTT